MAKIRKIKEISGIKKGASAWMVAWMVDQTESHIQKLALAREAMLVISKKRHSKEVCMLGLPWL